MLLGMLMLSAFYLREHNRVAAIMKSNHPSWDDERLFQTTKNIMVGSTARIIIQEYMMHVAQYNYQLLYKPSLLEGRGYPAQGRITTEFNIVYR